MEQNQIQQDTSGQLSEILLILDKEKKKIQAVSGIDQHGNLKTVDPSGKNQNQFMKVDRNGDVFSNFFSNFFSQLKNPTNFSFFRVPADKATETAEKLQQHIDTPSPKGRELSEQYEVKQQLKQNTMETTQTTTQTDDYRYKPEQIDWETMNNLGLSKEYLEKRKLLDPLLKGYKTNELVPVSLNLGTAVTRMDARLSLQTNNEGQTVVAIHGIRREPNLRFPFFGHEFSAEDKENLLKTGNMGRIVELTNPKNGETFPSIISVDRLTNELVALRSEWIKIPNEIKGVQLNEEQKQTLSEGKSLFIEGMTSKKGESFDATVQFNADKRYVEFLFDRSNSKNQHISQDGQTSQQAPRVFRDKELSDKQYEKLKGGQSVYISGLQTKKGSEYNGYITFNKDTGKTEFSFDNPEKLKEKVQPAQKQTTQKAASSQGKANKATSRKASQQTGKTPAKSSGRKM
ncbi:DUF3945 domain-containing protein [Flavobacterium sp.]|uniref:DUF3945 domain-containing protein n=1 Tax=Flavobacterium sp. TaxID=239 RepID=UPI003A924B84